MKRNLVFAVLALAFCLAAGFMSCHFSEDGSDSDDCYSHSDCDDNDVCTHDICTVDFKCENFAVENCCHGDPDCRNDACADYSCVDNSCQPLNMSCNVSPDCGVPEDPGMTYICEFYQMTATCGRCVEVAIGP